MRAPLLLSLPRRSLGPSTQEEIMNAYEKPAIAKVGSFKETTNATRYGGWFDFVGGYYWF